ncbi:uncharacterized protein UTRI_03310 [Ustilago trichophora]|uniref:Uncharacterized protein n=1 Tax=Ustilago trichophora TaxID=86804 RepID=A0A5C3E781_9BASI|nr:uncharacterized protein UTRI_03310 [Ustilago trichophora]
MANNNNNTSALAQSGSKPPAPKPSREDDTMQPYTDEPVPSYETALREGAGGGIGSGPSGSNIAAQPDIPAQPTYGCSPYTPHGTARIVIVPAPHCQHPQQFAQMHSAQAQTQALLPTPATMQTPTVRRAKPRFFLALLHGLIIYVLINLLVDLTVTRKW